MKLQGFHCRNLSLRRNRLPSHGLTEMDYPHPPWCFGPVAFSDRFNRSGSISLTFCRGISNCEGGEVMVRSGKVTATQRRPNQGKERMRGRLPQPCLRQRRWISPGRAHYGRKFEVGRLIHSEVEGSRASLRSILRSGSRSVWTCIPQILQT